MHAAAALDRALKKHLWPVLRGAGFERLRPRSGWRWNAKTIWAVNVRAVGREFCQQTGWPAESVCVGTGVAYRFMPQWKDIKFDKEGRPAPAEHECQLRLVLNRSVDQLNYVNRLPREGEQRRKDIWWVNPDGMNVQEVAEDIARAVRAQALPWFEQVSDLGNAFARVQTTRDCFSKYVVAMFLALELGDDQEYRRYEQLATSEAQSINDRLGPALRDPGYCLNRDDWCVSLLPENLPEQPMRVWDDSPPSAYGALHE